MSQVRSALRKAARHSVGFYFLENYAMQEDNHRNSISDSSKKRVTWHYHDRLTQLNQLEHGKQGRFQNGTDVVKSGR